MEKEEISEEIVYQIGNINKTIDYLEDIRNKLEDLQQEVEADIEEVYIEEELNEGV